jgi:hypothetical protein
MARLDFKWSEPTLNTYDHVDVNNFFNALPADFKVDSKPLLVFVTSNRDEDKQEMMNIDSSVLRDESISIGATMFRSIKIAGNKVTESHPYWKVLGGRDLPRMVVIDSNGKKVGAVEGKVSASKVYRLMKQAASKTYKTDLDTIVKETKTILTEIDQIEAKRAALNTKKEKSVTDRAAQWAKEEKELNDAMADVEKRETDLKKKWEVRVAKA